MRLDRRRLRTAWMLTDFDSSVNMTRALGRFLRGKDHRGLSIGPGSRRLANFASGLPSSVRRRLYRVTGAVQAIPQHQVRRISSDDIAHWATSQYRGGPYPAVLIGAPSGAAVHLAAALHAPFLLQTTLIAVRDAASDPDDPVGAMHRIGPLATQVADRNPDLAVYHMHDPAQDRPMLESMAYLRLKRLRLGRTYERFLEERLAPGGTIVLLDCTRHWRSTRVAERTYFQFGCLGGLSEEEYFHHGERIADYLAREGSGHKWAPPEPDGRRPEAEWGFHPAIRDDVEQVAERHGYRLHRLTFDEPQNLSPLVADLYRWWYRQRGLPADRLLVESYVQWDPLWTLRLAAVPFWMRFNMHSDFDDLQRYLQRSKPFDHIQVNLFSQGLWSPGVEPIAEWERLIRQHARVHGEIIGVDKNAFPADLGSTLRFQPAFASLPPRHPLPPPLDIEEIESFVSEHDRSPAVKWE